LAAVEAGVEVQNHKEVVVCRKVGTAALQDDAALLAYKDSVVEQYKVVERRGQMRPTGGVGPEVDPVLSALKEAGEREMRPTSLVKVAQGDFSHSCCKPANAVPAESHTEDRSDWLIRSS
jgi:hypothetical protein